MFSIIAMISLLVIYCSIFFFESHTSLISPKLNKLSRFVIRAVIYLFNKTPFKIVNKISNAFADLLSLGSNIKIIALKDKDI